MQPTFLNATKDGFYYVFDLQSSQPVGSYEIRLGNYQSIFPIRSKRSGLKTASKEIQGIVNFREIITVNGLF